MPGQAEGRKDGQTIFHTTLPSFAGGSNKITFNFPKFALVCKKLAHFINSFLRF